MTQLLSAIQQPITGDLQRFETALATALSSATLPMQTVLQYVSSVRGKRLRPTLVFLAARLFGEVNDITMRTALFAEILHTATLIHDDIVDDSEERRGQLAVHVRWNNASAVLAGDFLLSKAMLQLSDATCLPILQEMLQTTVAMSEGELMQRRQKAGDERQKTEDGYLELIQRKTALLFRSCCVGGVLSVMKEETEDERRKTELMGIFGLHLGMVFQMRDDIMDADDAEHVVFAEKLLPVYLERTLQALEALKPFVNNKEVYDTLYDLTLFCAGK